MTSMVAEFRLTTRKVTCRNGHQMDTKGRLRRFLKSVSD